MREHFDDLQAAEPITAIDGTLDEVSGTKMMKVPLPDVTITSRGFMPSEDLVTETRLRCWELVENIDFSGEIRVTFSSDFISGFDDTYTATVSFVQSPAWPKLCGLGPDPYEALSHALLSGS